MICKGFSQALSGRASGCPRCISQEVGAPFQHLFPALSSKIGNKLFPTDGKEEGSKEEGHKVKKSKHDVKITLPTSGTCTWLVVTQGSIRQR